MRQRDLLRYFPLTKRVCPWLSSTLGTLCTPHNGMLHFGTEHVGTEHVGTENGTEHVATEHVGTKHGTEHVGTEHGTEHF